MALLTGLTESGQEVPVQVDPSGRLVAEGLAGPQGPQGIQGPQGVKGEKGDKGDPGSGSAGPTLATAQASTSGTAIDFTGIPSWVKRVTVMLNGVSTNGVSSMRIQLGHSGGIETSDYNGATSYCGTGGTGAAFHSAGFDSVGVSSANANRYGSVVFTNLSSNVWIAHGVFAPTGGGSSFTVHISGSKTLSGTLDRVRITTANGTDTFDAGTINIMYE